MGALCCLKSNDKELTINVEYNQLDALLKEKYNKEGDIPNEKGYSHFPGNTNVLCFEITKYYEALKKTNGLTPEFINPKYADSTKSIFKSPARLECMMQDFPLLFTNDEKVGFTTYPIWFSFACCKNNLSDGVDKISKGLNAESAFSVEQNIFNCNVKILRKLNLIEIKDRDLTDKIIIHNKEIQIGPKLLIKPSFAVSVYQLKDTIKGNILLSANSTMILEGDEKIEKDIEINGTYRQIGNNVSYKENEFIKYTTLREDELEYY